MNLDKRDLNLLAEARAGKSPRVLQVAAFTGFAVMIIGGVYFLQGMVWCIGGMLAGLILLCVASHFSWRHHKKSKAEFINYYEKNGHLPPWPAEGK